MGLVTATLGSTAQNARFFRIAGPVATTITEFRPDGTLVWTNTPTNATFTVQMANSLGGASNWVDYVQTPATNGINTNRVIDFKPPTSMALIPAGSFTMGTSYDGAEWPLHTVYVSAFYMDRYEVTKALWDDVYNWAIAHGYSFEFGAAGKASNHPAQNMAWYEAVKWCNARSEKEGQTPAYYTSAGQTVVYRSGQVDVDNSWVKWNVGYRLPTEAEWEKAARSGSGDQHFPWGNTITHSLANYYSYSGYPYDTSLTRGYHPTFAIGGTPFTSPAGYFAPNEYGLYDMVGNVWEWCWDWHYPYSSGSQTDPRGPVSGFYRLIRGGGSDSNAIYCRSANRYVYASDSRGNGIGFRCVRPAGQ